MKDRDATLDALSKGVTMEATIEVINFTAAGSRRGSMKRIAALRKEGFELLAVVLPDRVCEYSLGNPQHLALAEELVSHIEKANCQRPPCCTNPITIQNKRKVPSKRNEEQ